MREFIRVIEEPISQTKTKLLWVSFPSINDLKALFTPRLENISFIKIENTITINLKNPAFREYFNDWVIRVFDKINSVDTVEKRIEKFNSEVRALVLLGQKEKKLSWETARGLFGEFLVIKQLLIEKKYSQIEILEGWHRPEPANHDFDFTEYSLEVKTVSRDSTTVKITSEHQLKAVGDKLLRLKLFRIEKIENSNVDSLGDLYNEIISILDIGAINIFETKCADDNFCGYLGPEYNKSEYKFTLYEDILYEVDQASFPRIKKEELNPSITKISYSLDISSIDKYKVI